MLVTLFHFDLPEYMWFKVWTQSFFVIIYSRAEGSFVSWSCQASNGYHSAYWFSLKWKPLEDRCLVQMLSIWPGAPEILAVWLIDTVYSLQRRKFPVLRRWVCWEIMFNMKWGKTVCFSLVSREPHSASWGQDYLKPRSALGKNIYWSRFWGLRVYSMLFGLGPFKQS